MTLPLQDDQSDNHQGDGQYLNACQRLVQKDPGQDGDLRKHCIVDQPRLGRAQLAQRSIPQNEGQRRVDHRQPSDQSHLSPP